MNDCLVTKLKGTVNNDSLEYLGMVPVRTTGTNGLTKFILTEAGQVKVLNGTVGGKTAFSVAANDDKWVVNYGTVVVAQGYDYVTLLLPKYTIKSLIFNNGGYVDMTQLKYSPIEILNCGPNATIVVDEEFFSGLKEFVANQSETVLSDTLDVSDWGKTGVGITLNIQGITSPKLVGSLNNAGCSNAGLYAPNTKTVSIVIETFVSNHWRAGRTTKTMTLHYLGQCDATFNGASVAAQQNNSLSWAPNASDNTKIDITLNGVTHSAVNPDDYIDD